LGDILHLQLQRGPIVGHENAVIEAHDAFAIVQPSEGWWRLTHRIAA